MYTEVSEEAKQIVRSNLITTTARLTFKDFFPDNIENPDLVLLGDVLTENGLKIADYCYNNGKLIGTAMVKEAEIEIKNPNQYDLEDKSFDLEIGVMLSNNTYEYIPYGEFTVSLYEDLKSSKKYRMIAYDNMNKLNPDFKKNENFNPTFPITAKNFYSQFMASYGIQIEEQTLPNENFLIEVMPNFDGYTGRSILMRLAEIFGSFAKINRYNKCQMYLKTQTQEQIGLGSMNSKLEIDKRYGPVNAVSIGMSNVEGENVTLKDADSIAEYGETMIRIDDNPFLYTESLRESVIGDLYDRLHNFSYIPVKLNLKALIYSDCGDIVQVRNMEDTEWIETIILNQYINIPRTRQSTIETKALSTNQQKLEYISNSKQAQTQTEIRVDKQEQIIEGIVSEIGDRTEKTSTITQEIDSISSRVDDITSFINEINANNEIHLTECAEGDNYVIDFRIKGSSNNFVYLTPEEDLTPNETLAPNGGSFTLVVDKASRGNPTNTAFKKKYNVAEPLRSLNNIYDEFVVQDNVAQIIRRIGGSKNIINYEDCSWGRINNSTGEDMPFSQATDYSYFKTGLIEIDKTYEYLFKYDEVRLLAEQGVSLDINDNGYVGAYCYDRNENYLGHVYGENNHFTPLENTKYLRIVVKTNITTELYAQELFSNYSVVVKLVRKMYLLDEEKIEDLGELIIPTYEPDTYIYLQEFHNLEYYTKYIIKSDYSDIFVTKVEMSSAIEQTAEEINLEVSKKVGNDEIISKINQSAEQISIEAEKISLSGKTLNLADNMAIISNNFNVDSNGNMTCANANVTGGNINLASNGNGDARMTIYNKNSSNNNLKLENSRLEINTSGNTYTYLANTHYVDRGYYGGVLDVSDGAGNITSVEASVIYTPSLVQTSKEENKKNFKKFSQGLDIIKDIEIYEYNMKSESDTDKKHIGFVIGEKYKYRKEVTSKENNGVDTYSFVSVCCKAIQEQQEQIEILQNKIKEMEEKSND